jgi:O-antigen/teichoic acid export membrane protein
MTSPRTAPQERRHRGTAALAVGSALSGLLAYVFFALTTRGLGPQSAAPVAVLWTYWAFAGAAVTFPLQHWITRSIIAHGEGSVRRSMARVVLALAFLSIGAVVVTGLLRRPLFHRDDLWFPLLTGALTLGAGLTGVFRGSLSGRNQLTAVGASLVAENALRCVAAIALYVAGTQDALAYGLALLAGNLVAISWPPAFRLAREGASSTLSPFGFLAGAGLAQLVNQVVLTGGPVVLALAGGSPVEVTALFAGLALFRAPYLIALGVMPQVTRVITSLVLSGNAATVERFRAVVVGGTVVVSLLAGAFGAWLGPDVLHLVFGTSLQLDAQETALVAVGCTVAVANLVLTVSDLAENRPKGVAGSWLGALLVSALVFVVLGALAPLERTVWAFLIAEVAAFLTLLGVGLRRRARA